MSILEERQYQTDLDRAIEDEWHRGARGVIGVLPTGGGKSVVISKKIIDCVKLGQATCSIAHRQELVGQLSLHLAKRGIVHKIEAPKNIIRNISEAHRIKFNGRCFINPASQHSVASVDTLLARTGKNDDWRKQIKLAVIDETHHVLQENKWGKVLKTFPNAKFFGATATPDRTDGKGLGAHADGCFEAMVIGPSMRELIDAGYLTEYRIAVPSTLFDPNNLKVGSTGDFTFDSMRAESRRSCIVGSIVDSYIKFAHGKRGLTFCTDVETAVNTSMEYKRAGIPSECITDKTPDHIRTQILRDLESGKILQVCSVDVLGEGIDIPAVEVVSMGRPTQSLIVYRQQFGRVLRPAPGKTHGLVIDHVSNVANPILGLPDRHIEWSLDQRPRGARSKQAGMPVSICGACFLAYPAYKVACPYCGCRRQPAGRSLPEHVAGDLLELDPTVLAKMRAAAVLSTPAAVRKGVTHSQGKVAGYAAAQNQQIKINMQSELQKTMAVWSGWERLDGLNDNEIMRKFYLTFNVDMLTAVSGDTPTMRKTKEAIEHDMRNRNNRNGSAVGHSSSVGISIAK